MEQNMPEQRPFKLVTKYSPKGDQPAAIDELVANINSGVQDQVLLGVTGSGKTFTMANVIARTNRPALILAHNKTLAAQLYGEFREFFPENAVEYSAIMIIISLKPMFPLLIPILKKTVLSMTISTSSAMRRPMLY